MRCRGDWSEGIVVPIRLSLLVFHNTAEFGKPCGGGPIIRVYGSFCLVTAKPRRYLYNVSVILEAE